MSGYELVTETVTSNGLNLTDTAVCPTGKKVLGGGVSVSSSNLSILESVPSGTLNETAWTGSAVRIVQVGGVQHTLTVYAICATV